MAMEIFTVGRGQVGTRAEAQAAEGIL